VGCKPAADHERKIVTETSACIPGYPRTLVEADHSAMCKFQSKDDNNYKKVSGVLIKWVTELERAPKSKGEEKVSTAA
jgi:hypothetical protein